MRCGRDGDGDGGEQGAIADEAESAEWVNPKE
jgi:hypothetical protein